MKSQITSVETTAATPAAPDCASGMDIESVVYFIRERYSMYLKRQAGEPPPYTDDPILRDYRFCNVEREHDAVTILIKRWLDQHANDDDLWFAAVIGRCVNYPPSLNEIGRVLPWPAARERYLTVMAERRAREDAYDPAYRSPIDSRGTPTAQYQAEKVFDPLWARREQLRTRPGDTLRGFGTRLLDALSLSGWGGFIVGQFIADLKYFPPLETAPDWRTFAMSGPGSRPGLARICGLPPKYKWDEAAWYATLLRLRSAIESELEAIGLGDLDLQNTQSVCCEMEKFLRARDKGEMPKQRYHPRAADGAITARSKQPRRRPAAKPQPDLFPLSAAATPAAAAAIGPTPDATSQPPAASTSTSTSPPPPPPHKAAASAASATANLNPFANLSAMRLSQDFAADTHVKKLLTTVPVGRPSPQDFFRVNPSPAYQMPAAAIIELKDERETYFVRPEIVPEIVGEYRAAMIVTVINRQGVLRLWCLKLPSPDGRREEWARSALEAAELAMTRWVRLKSNMSLGAYEIFEAEAKYPDPVWPDVAFPDLLQIAFRDRLIDSIDHPVVKRLRGAP